LSVHALHIRIAVMVVLAAALAVSLVWWHDRSVEAQQGPLIVNYLLDDRGICDTDCGLREAILSAAPGTIIQVPADRFLLTLNTEIVIDKPLTIRGAGADQTFIEPSITLASSTVRVFRVTSEDVVISDLTIRHGSVSGDGGAILNEGGLTIENSILTNNHASINGGAVANKGTLRLMNTTIIDNSASLNGGGVFSGSNANLVVEQSFVLNNSAINGGGIYNELRGKIEIIDSGIRDNIADSGGGVHSQGSSVVSVDNTTFLGNTATSTGGGIFSLGNFSIDRSSLRENIAVHGAAVYVGAGDFDMTLVQVLDNSAELGGGAFVAGDGSLSATQSTLENNAAISSGGAVFVRDGGGTESYCQHDRQ
jgi:predicted outer membrane repeat protein